MEYGDEIVLAPDDDLPDAPPTNAESDVPGKDEPVPRQPVAPERADKEAGKQSPGGDLLPEDSHEECDQNAGETAREPEEQFSKEPKREPHVPADEAADEPRRLSPSEPTTVPEVPAETDSKPQVPDHEREVPDSDKAGQPEPHRPDEPQSHHRIQPEPHPEPHHPSHPEPHPPAQPEPCHPARDEPHPPAQPEPYQPAQPEPQYPIQPEPHYPVHPQPHQAVHPVPNQPPQHHPRDQPASQPGHHLPPMSATTEVAQIIASGLNPEMQNYAVSLAQEAIANWPNEMMRIAQHLMGNFEQKYGAPWHCVVSDGQLGFYVRYDPAGHIYFSICSKTIFLFRNQNP